MRSFRLIVLISSIVLSSSVFAQDAAPNAKHQPCDVIAKACKAAGYEKGDKGGKRFWKDCMKPIILGQTVSGVVVDANTVKECREHKTDELSKELQEMKNLK